jgi:hypothetical protein
MLLRCSLGVNRRWSSSSLFPQTCCIRPIINVLWASFSSSNWLALTLLLSLLNYSVLYLLIETFSIEDYWNGFAFSSYLAWRMLGLLFIGVFFISFSKIGCIFWVFLSYLIRYWWSSLGGRFCLKVHMSISSLVLLFLYKATAQMGQFGLHSISDYLTFLVLSFSDSLSLIWYSR